MSPKTVKESKKPPHSDGTSSIPEGYTLFTYRAIDQRGKRITGKIAARSAKDAARELENKSYKILALDKPEKEILRTSPLKMSLFNLVVFFRELSLICSSGLLIQRGINVLADQSEEAHVKSILMGLRKALDSGRTLSDAMSLYPECFTSVHKHIIKSAEAGGTMDSSLDYLARVTEREMILKRRVKGALNYPAMIFTVGIVGFIITISLIRPYMETLITSLNIELPFYTRITMSIAGLISNFYVIAVSLVGIVLIAPRFVRFARFNPTGKRAWDHLMLSLPFIREIRKKALLINSFLILISLLKAGVHLSNALRLAADTCDSPAIQDAFRDIVEKIQQGGSFAENMHSHAHIFPQNLMAMVKVGEECGELPEVLEKIVFLYEVELENTIESFMKLIEPLAIALLGFVAALVLLSFFIPIYMSVNSF